MCNLIAFGQSYTDSVVISREAQKNCIKWHNDNQQKDSIISVLKYDVSLCDSINNINFDAVNRSEQLIELKEIELIESKKETAKSEIKRKRNTKISASIGGVAGFLLGLFTLNLLK